MIARRDARTVGLNQTSPRALLALWRESEGELSGWQESEGNCLGAGTLFEARQASEHEFLPNSRANRRILKGKGLKIENRGSSMTLTGSQEFKHLALAGHR